MKRHDVGFYYCSKCMNPKLKLRGSEISGANEIIYEAQLECHACGESYVVKKGVPRFVSEKNYADSFGYQWNIHRQTQLDSYTGLSISRKRLFEVTGWPEQMNGQVILEAGSGSGRFTEILLQTRAEVFSFDYSSAVEANWLNNGYSSNLHLFQGNILNIPLKKHSFDKVICLGVLQHTLDPEKSFKSLVQYVRPGGELVIDVYGKSLTALLQWKYLLRFITRRMDKRFLYKIIEWSVPKLLPAAEFFRRIAGKAGARLLPIVEYSHLIESKELNRQWAILDTFDMYSPAHDHPQSISTVARWFNEAGFVNISVRPGPNGVLGKGISPE